MAAARRKIAHITTLARMAWGIAALVVVVDLALGIPSIAVLVTAPAVAMTCTVCAWVTRENAETRALVRKQIGEVVVEAYGGAIRHRYVNRIESAGGERVGEGTGPFTAYRA